MTETPEVGHLIVTKYRASEDEPWQLRVKESHPRIRVDCDFLQQLSIDTVRGEDKYVSYAGDVLTIHATPRLVYVRVPDSWDSETDSELMVWPD